MDKFRKVVVILVVVVVAFYILADFNEFNDSGESLATVSLFYYDSSLDMDETGNILCSDQGLVEVKKQVEDSDSLITDTVEMLIEGDAVEGIEGIEAEGNFPLDGFSLASSTLEDGVLYLTFNDPNFSSSGGSCMVRPLSSQLIKTAEQFEEVDEVTIVAPDHVFQP